MKKTIYCPDIECDSCIKVLKRVFSKLQGIEKYEISKTAIEVTYDESLIKPEALLSAIHEKGYRAAFEPFTRKQLKERARDFIENKKKYHIEYQMLRNVALTFLILLGLQAAFIYYMSTTQPNFVSNYAQWIFYLTLSVVAIGGAIWHYRSYQTEITCMIGMMIGMTIGMQTGMMIGAILGATNGFFVGALVGMLLSVGVGAVAGSCCGIMGMLEGIMAGIMGGTMGAMISVMMLYKYLVWFMPVYMLLNIIVLIGFSYMIFEEIVEDNKNIIKRPIKFSTFFILCAATVIVLTLIMLIAPASINIV